MPYNPSDYMEPIPGNTYRHYKGERELYVVDLIAQNQDSDDPNAKTVVYRKLGEQGHHAKSRENWIKPVIVDGNEVPRYWNITMPQPQPDA